MEKQLKNIIISTNLTGKLMETVWLLQEVFSDDEIEDILKLTIKALKIPAENRKVYYFNSYKADCLKPVAHWNYNKEDFK